MTKASQADGCRWCSFRPKNYPANAHDAGYHLPAILDWLDISESPSRTWPMSRVTNVMVNHSILESAATKETLARPVERNQAFRNIADDEAGDAWGGYKFPEVDLWGAAFNYVSDDLILSFVAAVPWQYRDEVQVFILGEEDDRWRIFEFRSDQLERVL